LYESMRIAGRSWQSIMWHSSPIWPDAPPEFEWFNDLCVTCAMPQKRANISSQA
jgi:hypothetical protein